VLIEQAIFASAQTLRAQGYQLVSHSPGLSESEARELAVWGPSHDALLERPGEPSSTNFFKLSSGRFCVSRTTSAGAEYSGRGGHGVYTQFLVVPPDVLARFGNNPFAILRAATARGAIGLRQPIPETLEPLRLVGRSPAVDQALLANLARDPGPAAMATLVQTALACDRLAIATSGPSELLIAGLIAALPVECRSEFSFTTGLKFSPSRPVRIASLGSDPAGWRSIARSGVTLLNMDQNEPCGEPRWDGWAGFVAHVLSTGKFSLLAAELDRSRSWLSCANLDALSEQVRVGLPSNTRGITATEPADKQQCSPPEPVLAEAEISTNRRADRAHVLREKVQAVAEKHVTKSTVEELAEALASQPPEVLELLEHIDDLIFAAIGGDKRALTELEGLWPVVVLELDEALVEQSREQYLRCVLSICSEPANGEDQRPDRALAATDVLCVLFGE
jgi:hypothetical protein